MDASVSTNSNTARRYTGTSTQPVAGYSSLGNYYRKMDGTLGSTVSKIPVVSEPAIPTASCINVSHDTPFKSIPPVVVA